MKEQQVPPQAIESPPNVPKGWPLVHGDDVRFAVPSLGIPVLTATLDGCITGSNEAARAFFGQQHPMAGMRLVEWLRITLPGQQQVPQGEIASMALPDPQGPPPDGSVYDGLCKDAAGHEVPVRVMLQHSAGGMQAMVLPFSHHSCDHPTDWGELCRVLRHVQQEATGITERDELLQLFCEQLATCACLDAVCVMHGADGRMLHAAGASADRWRAALLDSVGVSGFQILTSLAAGAQGFCLELPQAGGFMLPLGEGVAYLALCFAGHVSASNRRDLCQGIATVCHAMLERLAIQQHSMQLEKALQQAEVSCHSIFGLMPTPVFLYDMATLHMLDANEAFCAQYGYNKAGLQELSVQDILAPEFAHAWDGLGSADDPVTHLPNIVRHRRKDGSLFWAEVARRAVMMMDRACLLCSAQDVTERMANETELKLAAQVFHGSQDAIAILDAQQRILRVNQTFMDSTGYAAEHLLHKRLEDLGWRMSDAHDGDLAMVWEQLQAMPHWAGEWWATRFTGESFPEWARVSRLVDEQGHTLHYLVMLTDLSERREQERRLVELQMRDHLTGLPNRDGFLQALQQAIQRQQERLQPSHVAVLCLDIDRFKTINDSLGVASGDELLRQVGKRLCRLLRDGDMVARPGGDEFYVLLAEVVDRMAAAAVSGRILAAFQDPFCYADQEITVSPSIGVSLYPKDSQDPPVLLKQAEAAMYQAKRYGGNQQLLYSAALHKSTADRLQQENDLRHAMSNGELFLLYQPQVNIVNGQIVATEALLRWLHPKKGVVSPAEFIPIAEETGLIVPIGEWVLRQACLQNVSWQRQCSRRIPVSVNLSAVQFRSQDVVALVQRALAESGLDPAYLELELTEGTVMMDVARAIKVMKELKRIGVQLAIDDFGTGYSSLAYLKRFPIDTLKVDQSFIRGIANSMPDAEIARTIVQLAYGLGLRVVAEGVETIEQLLFLKEQRCHHIQGFFYSPPVPHDEIAAWLRRQPLRA